MDQLCFMPEEMPSPPAPLPTLGEGGESGGAESGRVQRRLMGLLWFDAAADGIEAKAARAVASYMRRFGEMPEVVEAAPGMFGASGGPVVVLGLLVEPRRYVQANHVFVASYVEDMR